MIQAVFFDAVGTLIHPDPPAAVVYAQVGRRFGSCRAADDILPRFLQAFDHQERHDLTQGLATSEAREHERWRQIVTDVLDDVTDPAACFQELFHYFGQANAWRVEPDAGAVLRELTQRRFVLGIASNHDRRLRGIVAGLPALAPIRHLAISSEIGWRKPAAGFFHAVCRMAKLPAAAIVFVGDDLVNDYDAATAAGMKAILYDTKRQASRPVRIDALFQLLDHDALLGPASGGRYPPESGTGG